MRLSFYTFSYTDKQKMSIADCLARIAKTGYAGIDESSTFGNAINSDSVTAERRREIRAAVEKNKLRVEAVITHADLTATIAENKPLDLNASIDLAADLQSPVVTFHLGGPQDGFSEKELWNKTVQVIKSAADYGASKHVGLAIDLGVWPPWIVNTYDQLAKLFNDVGSPNFGVNFDPSYLSITGADPVRFVKRFGNRIMHVHLKDNVGEYPNWEHKIPGKGELNYVPIIEALESAKFKGALAVECFVEMKFEEACDDGYAAMAAAFKKAGARLEK